MSIVPTAGAVGPQDVDGAAGPLDPAAVEAWLDELGIVPLERADREGVASWDLVLDGRRRADLRITLIVDPGLAVLAWAQFAPALADGFRRSFRQLLRWNDEYPFVKFSLAEDERLVLAAEIPSDRADARSLGLALARILAVSDRLVGPSRHWLETGSWPVTLPDDQPSRGAALLDRFHADLGELDIPVDGEDEPQPVRRSGLRRLFARGAAR
jgi:hypothetical protein